MSVKRSKKLYIARVSALRSNCTALYSTLEYILTHNIDSVTHLRPIYNISVSVLSCNKKLPQPSPLFELMQYVVHTHRNI